MLKWLRSKSAIPLLFSWLISVCAFLIATALFVGSRPEPSRRTEISSKPWFRDVTTELGLDFVHDAGPTGSYFMPQIMGSGAAIFDFDNDNRLDLYLLQNAGPDSASRNRLYRQLPNGHFQDVSAGSGLDVAGYHMGIAIGDINNDGKADVLATSVGSTRMFVNRGDGKFEDLTNSIGIDNLSWGTSASFVDFDRDGWLDIVVVNYVDYDATRECRGLGAQPEFCHPKAFSNSVSRLFQNRGLESETGVPKFEDVTVASGLARQSGPGLGVVCADFDGDGWQDIFVANDNHANYLWINQKNGTFVDEALERGLAFDSLGRAPSNMGVALGDINEDGLFDLVITHMVNELHNVWLQGPQGMFREQTIRAGLGATSWRGTGFGTVLGDFNLDGHLDLAVVNGAIQRSKSASSTASTASSATFWQPYAERNQLLAGSNTGVFRDISADNSTFCGTPAVMRGLASGDLNGDGTLDLLGTTIAGAARIYSTQPGDGHWLNVRLLDSPRPRDAYGAVITLIAGQRKLKRWLNPGSSYLCSNSPIAHFGLGPIDRIDSIEVIWPDATIESFPSIAVDQSLVIKKGEGTAAAQGEVQ